MINYYEFNIFQSILNAIKYINSIILLDVKLTSYDALSYKSSIIKTKEKE